MFFSEYGKIYGMSFLFLLLFIIAAKPKPKKTLRWHEQGVWWCWWLAATRARVASAWGGSADGSFADVCVFRAAWAGKWRCCARSDQVCRISRMTSVLKQLRDRQRADAQQVPTCRTRQYPGWSTYNPPACALLGSLCMFQQIQPATQSTKPDIERALCVHVSFPCLSALCPYLRLPFVHACSAPACTSLLHACACVVFARVCHACFPHTHTWWWLILLSLLEN